MEAHLPPDGVLGFQKGGHVVHSLECTYSLGIEQTTEIHCPRLCRPQARSQLMLKGLQFNGETHVSMRRLRWQAAWILTLSLLTGCAAFA